MHLKFYVNFLIFFIATSLFTGCKPAVEDIDSLYKKLSCQHQQALKANPLDNKKHLEAASFFYRFNDYEKVIDILKDKTDKESEILKAKSFAQLKEYTSALELFDKIGEIDDSQYLYLYAYTLEKKNLFAKAVRLYEKVSKPFKEEALLRLKNLGIKIDIGFPQEIIELLNEGKDFIAGLNRDSSVNIFVDESIEVTPDNKAISTIHVIKKILNEKGKESAEVQIGYDSTYERVELEYARTITADRHTVLAGRENTRDVSQYLNFPLYSNAKVFIVSMPAVEVGSIIEYKLKVYSSKLVNNDFFFFSYHLYDREPIAKAKFKFVLPKNKLVSFKILNKEYAKNFNLLAKKTYADNKAIYSWEFKNLPSIVIEEKMPEICAINPAIMISGFKDWQQVYQWWYGLFEEKQELTPEIKDFLQELTKDCKTDFDKARKIYEFCSRNIRYVGVEYGESGYQPHKASEIFWNRYGDCKDKAVLLVSMLRACGFKAYPVLIPTRQSYPIEDNLATLSFDHAIAVLELNNKLIFMDPTSTTTSFTDLPANDQERKVLVILDNGYKLLTTPQLKNNIISYTMTAKLNKDEDALIERKIITKGFYATFQRAYLTYSHPQKIEDDIANKMKEVSPSSQLIDYRVKNVDDLTKIPVLRYKFESKKFLNPVRNLRIVPIIKDLIIDLGYIAKDKREYPIEFDCLFKNISQYNIMLAKNLSFKYLPADCNVKTKWFDFTASFKQYANNLLQCNQIFSLKKRIVPINEYKEFKQALEKVFYLLKEQIILEKK